MSDTNDTFVIPAVYFDIPQRYTLNTDLIVQVLTWVMRDAKFLDGVEAGTIPLPKHVVNAGWRQSTWLEQQRNGFCNTTCCFAGATVLEANYVPAWNVADVEFTPDFRRSDNYYRYVNGELRLDQIDKANILHIREEASAVYPGKIVKGKDGKDKVVADFDQPAETVDEVAQRLLGITEWEAGNLFSGGNGVRSIVYCLQGAFMARGLDLRDFVPEKMRSEVSDLLENSNEYMWSAYGNDARLMLSDAIELDRAVATADSNDES